MLSLTQWHNKCDQVLHFPSTEKPEVKNKTLYKNFVWKNMGIRSFREAQPVIRPIEAIASATIVLSGLRPIGNITSKTTFRLKLESLKLEITSIRSLASSIAQHCTRYSIISLMIGTSTLPYSSLYSISSVERRPHAPSSALHRTENTPGMRSKTDAQPN